MIRIGMIIEDRYEILEKIGTGGMSDVFKARDHKLNRYVAIKFLKPEFCEDRNFVANFKVEAQSAAALLHPNVVNVYDVNETEGIYYIIMEYVDGVTLKKYIKINGRLPVKEATSIAIQVVQGMEAAHNAGIVHRDIKPQNILISREGKIKVTDFGIARTASANTLSSDVLGSAQYISPEQARSDVIDTRSDIYSFGIVFYEMLTGELPFSGDSPVNVALMHIQEQVPLVNTIVSQIPSSVVKIVEKCTQKKPDKRYQKASSLLADLKTSLVNPNDDFVVLDTEEDNGATVIMSRRDAQMLRDEGRSRENVSSSPISRPSAKRHYTLDEEKDEDIDDPGDYTDDKSGRRFDKILTICGIIAGVIIVIVLVLLIFTGVFGNGCAGGCSGSSSKNETEVTSEDDSSESTSEEESEMPNVVGMNIDRAEKLLEDMGLQVVIKTEDADEDEDTVIKQSVKKGTEVKKGTTVTLTVSSGEKTISLTNVVGMSRENAISTLEGQGLKVEIDTENSDTVEEGTVISMSPAAKSEVKEGSSVRIVVSLGSDSITVPNCMGSKEVDAREMCEGMGFKVQISYSPSSEENNGRVIGQSLTASTNVNKGTTITLHVGTYTPPETTTPAPTETTTTEETTESPVTP